MALALSTDTIARMELRTGESRGQAINRRMKALRWTKVRLGQESDLSRSHVYNVLNDVKGVTEIAYAKAEAALDRAERLGEEEEEEGPAGLVATEQGYVEFEVTGDFGVRVVMKAPVENAAELEPLLARLIADLRAGRESTP